MQICEVCNDRPVGIKKRKMCFRCYQQTRNKTGPFIIDNKNYEFKAKSTIKKHSENREMEFIKNFFNHKKWVHHPGIFRFPSGECYEPDFYDGERNVFIEVAGTRQAYHQNKKKYEFMKLYFPMIAFEVRITTGGLLEDAEIKWAHQTQIKNVDSHIFP